MFSPDTLEAASDSDCPVLELGDQWGQSSIGGHAQAVTQPKTIPCKKRVPKGDN